MREQFCGRKFVAREDLLESLLARDERLDRPRVVEYSRENVRLEVLERHLAHAGKNLVEAHFSRCSLQRIGEQWPEERDGRDAFRDALEIARESEQGPFFPAIKLSRRAAGKSVERVEHLETRRHDELDRRGRRTSHC